MTRLSAEEVAERAAVIGSRELLIRMVATGHIWPATMAAWVERHGVPDCLKAPEQPGRPKGKAGRPKGSHARNRRRDVRDFSFETIRVLNHVSEREGVQVEELRGHDQHKQFIMPRRRAVRIMRRLGFSLNTIARAMNRDRASILNSLRGGRK